MNQIATKIFWCGQSKLGSVALLITILKITMLSLLRIKMCITNQIFVKKLNYRGLYLVWSILTNFKIVSYTNQIFINHFT